jgi:hypothetical protein
MNLVQFHYGLLGIHPTPEQRRLYDVFPQKRGFSSEEQNAERFVATFIAALSDTWDATSMMSSFKVSFAIPRLIEPWCIDQVNLFLEQMKARRHRIAKGFIPQFLQAVRNVETGTRVFSLVEAPKRWVAFGFSFDSAAPEWLKEGLLR